MKASVKQGQIIQAASYQNTKFNPLKKPWGLMGSYTTAIINCS
jgi:hypothetical protein